MPRIAYYSDIHTENVVFQSRFPWTDRYPLDLGPNISSLRGNTDIVVLAGDIGSGRKRQGVSAIDYAADVADYLRVPTILVPGNHEYYHFVFEDTREAMLNEQDAHDGVHVLDRGEIVFDISGTRIRILGATLWTDYELVGDRKVAMKAGRRMLNDHRLILTARGMNWMPEDALEEHWKSRKWLLERLSEPFDGKTLVVTHHVPHRAGNNTRFPVDAVGASFTSDCDDLMIAAARAGVVGWIFGHNHWNGVFDVPLQEGSLQLLTAQPGYQGEPTGWKGPGILEI